MTKSILKSMFYALVLILLVLVFLNSGSSTSIVYGGNTGAAVLSVEAKRYGKATIELGSEKIFEQDLRKITIGEENIYSTNQIEVTCLKTIGDDDLENIYCGFRNELGNIVKISVLREGYLKISTAIEIISG